MKVWRNEERTEVGRKYHKKNGEANKTAGKKE
jgi:hypothetical protein